MKYALLTNRSVLRITGTDRIAFLQGLITNDVVRLEQAGAHYAALLTPQGKYLFSFFLYHDGDGILLDCEAERAQSLLKRLTLYRLRSDVQIAVSDAHVAALWRDDGLSFDVDDAVTAFTDPRVAALGMRAVVPKDAVFEGTKCDGDAYDLWRLQQGVPDDSRDLTPEKSFPMQFGFEALHAIDFHKGCYVGQEVTARTKHLGTLRKILCQLRLESGVFAPMGSTLLEGEKKAGVMLSSRGDYGLALLQADLVLAAGDAGLLLQDDRLQEDSGGCVRACVPSWFKIVLDASERGGKMDSAT